MTAGLPLLSVIVPCRNERRHISGCLHSLLVNDYPRERLEVLVIDGMSSDGSRELVAAYAARYPVIRMLDNPDLSTPAAINRGIRASRGEAVIILGSHAKAGPDFLRRNAEELARQGADCVGGTIATLPGGDTRSAEAIALALSSRFGIGNSYFRLGVHEPRPVDTVPYGCYRREVFDRIGLFNERMIRNQDIEFNLRLRRSGGRIILVPDIRSSYLARGTMAGLFGQNFGNGFWIFYGLRFAAAPFSLRHLVPCVFVLSLLSGLAAAFAGGVGWFLLTVLAAYGAANTAASLIAAGRYSGLFPRLALAFTTLHVSYGLGSLWGIAMLAGSKVAGREAAS